MNKLVSKGSGTKHRNISIEIKAVGDDGFFSGYGSVFGVVDTYNEVVEKGAFVKSLAEIVNKGRKIPVLWQHRSAEPIGFYLSLSEDEHGLKVDGTLLINDVAKAKEAYALLKAGVINGLSIGYQVRDSSFDEKTYVRHLKELDLMEISLVTFPANEDSRINSVKSGQLPTELELKQVLCGAGLTTEQADVLVESGYKGLVSEPLGQEAGEFLNYLKNFTLE